jgi:hypothetical protein
VTGTFRLDAQRGLGEGPRQGTWRPIPGGDHVAGALVGCPRCGFSCTVWDHQIAPDGTVAAGACCASCGEGLRATLEGWESNTYAQPAAEPAPRAESVAEECLTSPEHWAAFLRAGGRLDWREWVELTPEARASMEQAGRLVEAERAAAVADALLGQLAEAALKRLDGAAIQAGLDAAERHLGTARAAQRGSGP